MLLSVRNKEGSPPKAIANPGLRTKPALESVEVAGA
jgi:hypothetical protein